MSDYQTYRLSTGGFADVPNEKAEEWARRMNARGVKFEPADVSADMQVGEPEVIKTTPPAPAPAEPSMLDRFLETGSDALRGGIRGATMGYGDKLEAGTRSLFSGRPYADEFAAQNAMQDQAARRSPVAYNTAKTLGGAPYDLAAAVAGAPGGLAGEMASGGMLGQLRGAGMSRSPSLEGTLEDANRGGAEGAAWGLGGGMLGRFLGAGSDALTSAAPRARASALGEIGPAARAQRKLKGDDFVENLPQAADELGMTPEVPMDWRHPIDSMRSMLTFKKPGDYAEQAQGLMDDVHGPARGQAVADATAQGVSAPREALIDDMSGAVRGQPRNYKRDPYAMAMERNMLDVPQGAPSPNAPPQLTASQLDELKHGWEAGGFKGPDEIQTSLEAIPARASRDAATAARGQLHGAIDEMALPETADAFHSANDAYGNAASIANMARAKQLDINTQSPFSLPNVGRAIGGFAGGATLGGQVAGFPGAVVGGAAGMLGNKAMQQYGPDMVADFLRAGPGQLHPSTPAGSYDAATGAFQALPFGAPGGSMRDASVLGTMGAAVGGAPGAVGGAALGAMGRPGVQAATGAGMSQTSARDRGMPDADMVNRFTSTSGADAGSLDAGRGYLVTDVVMDALRNDPQSLGPYASQFAQAMGAGSNQQDAISTLISKLSRTDSTFRTQVLPALRARTGGM